jgi:hypothetical protein
MNPSASSSLPASLWTRLLVIGVLLVAGALWVRQGDQLLWSLQGTRGPGERPPPGNGTGGTPAPAEPLYYGADSGQTAHADGIIAVTGSYGVGTSVLYVIDTKSRQLAVYEARGGSANTRKLFLVGARRIDLDLQLEGYNDDSEHSYEKLRDMFRKAGHPVPTGDVSGRHSDAPPGRKEYTPGTPPKAEVNK